jgi:hypothetical protein
LLFLCFFIFIFIYGAGDEDEVIEEQAAAP